MYPEAFAARMREMLGDETDAFLAALDGEPEKGLRVNTIKLTPEEFARISPFSLAPSPFARDGFVLTDGARAGAGKHPYHAAGLYYMQEPSAMTAAEALDAQPGERVLDLCAAPGGKATKLAGAVGRDGLLIANEIVRSRAQILASNLERMGAGNSVVTSAEPERLCTALAGFFDRVLVDAPCSGEGMFRKDEEAAACWSAEHVRACAARQEAILESALKALRPGGTLVYSTCTFSPEENEQVIAALLGRHADITLCEITEFPHSPGFAQYAPQLPDIAHAARIFPHREGGEGHFVAKLRRAGEAECAGLPAPAAAEKSLSAAFETLFASIFTTAPRGRLIRQGEYLFLAPESMPALPHIPVVWPGIQAAHIAKNRLEPCHHLFCAAQPDALRQAVRLSAEDAACAAFLRGESIPFSGTGYAGVLVDGYTLGFGKVSDGQLKNRYPKGLRLRG